MDKKVVLHNEKKAPVKAEQLNVAPITPDVTTLEPVAPVEARPIQRAQPATPIFSGKKEPIYDEDDPRSLNVPVNLNNNTNRQRLTRADVERMRDKDREKVKGIFRNYEVPGGSLSFSIKLWPGDQVESYTLFDGEIATVPLGVAKHLNKNGWYPRHEYALDQNGKKAVRIGEKIRRFGFQSLEFVDTDDVGYKPLVTVENLPLVNSPF